MKGRAVRPARRWAARPPALAPAPLAGGEVRRWWQPPGRWHRHRCHPPRGTQGCGRFGLRGKFAHSPSSPSQVDDEATRVLLLPFWEGCSAGGVWCVPSSAPSPT